MIATKNKTERHGACPKHAPNWDEFQSDWEDPGTRQDHKSLVLWPGVLLGLNLLLLLHHGRRAHLLVGERHLMDGIGGKIFLSLLRQH
jgi:hypothetical protein